MSGAWSRPPFSDAASTASAFGAPVAHRLVPSSGSTAMSTSRIAAAVVAVRRHADLLADVQHRRFVTLALADDDGAVDRDRVHLAAASPRRRPGRTCGGRPVPSCARRRWPPARRRAGSRARGRSRDSSVAVVVFDPGGRRDCLAHVCHVVTVRSTAGSSHRVGLSVR